MLNVNETGNRTQILDSGKFRFRFSLVYYCQTISFAILGDLSRIWHRTQLRNVVCATSGVSERPQISYFRCVECRLNSTKAVSLRGCRRVGRLPRSACYALTWLVCCGVVLPVCPCVVSFSEFHVAFPDLILQREYAPDLHAEVEPDWDMEIREEGLSNWATKQVHLS